MRLAILGAGDVGSSVAKLAAEYGHTVTAFADSQSSIVDPNGVDVETALERKESEGILGSGNQEDALTGPYDVLVEATPTTFGDAEPAFGHLRAALERDRDVVLSNKGPVAKRYGDVRKLERESEGEVLFEATVGGGIPVLSTIDNVGTSHITAVRGVLNGLTNFLLTRMAAEGLDYEHVLAEAQDLGVADSDPRFEVMGSDTSLKCAIIANVLGGDEREFTLEDVETEGIKDIPTSVLELAREDGRTVRLIGEIGSDTVRVSPRLVPENDALAITGTNNVVQIETEHAGRLNLSGRGNGGPEAATAVFADIGRLG